MTKQKYTVRILDNFHFMDRSEEYNSGIFNTYDEAVDKCKSILNEFLEDAVRPNDSADSLHTCWLMYGENPLIFGDATGNFSSSEFVKQRCEELTNSKFS